jgi:hypothetical protein
VPRCRRPTAEAIVAEWKRLSCTSFRGDAVRLQLHALAYNLANFLRTLALPGEVAQWSLTRVRGGGLSGSRSGTARG